MTTADLLEKWREATRAALLAQRLAEVAAEGASRADHSAAVSEEIARMAERAADAAEEAAATARKVADESAQFAAESRGSRLAEADRVAGATKDDENTARDAYHVAEHEARVRHDEETPPD